MSLPIPSKRQLSEAQVKKMLGIDNFRQMSKAKVIEFISAIPQMDPEVAIKALEQFPELANMALGIAKETRESLVEALKTNERSSEASLAVINAVIDVLDKELQKEELTSNDRLHIVDCLMKLAQESRNIHKDDQNFILKGLAILGSVVGATLLGVVAVLGANGGIQMPGIGDDDEDEKDEADDNLV